MARLLCRTIFGVICLAILLGCSEDASPIPLSKVTGIVTYKGAKLPKGTVSFMPLTGTNTSSGDVVGGNFSLSTFTKGDGVPPGEYKVTITSWEKLPEMGTEGVPAIPKKYFDVNKSGLTAKVSSDKSQTINFDLLGE